MASALRTLETVRIWPHFPPPRPVYGLRLGCGPSWFMTFQLPLSSVILISLVLLSSCCSLCIKMERIRKWFTIDSNFKRPILNRTDRVPMMRA